MHQHSPLHRKLSFNITREVCSYQGGDYEQLASVLPREVLRFDLITNTPRRLWHLKAKVKVGELYASVFIAENTVFVCGGYESFNHTRSPETRIFQTGNCAYILNRVGSVKVLPHMLIHRHTHGIFYQAGEIYVFGGANVNYLALKLCEKFVISDQKWEAIPKMREARRGFNPCWYASAVYICGGMQTSIEIFDLRSSTFTLVPGLYLPEAEHCTAAVTADGELVVVSKNFISRLQVSGFMCLRHSPYRPCSYSPPVLRGLLIYVVSVPTICYGINSVTGELSKEISLR